MEEVFKQDDITISLGKKGLDRYTKASYPVRYGRYSEIETSTAIYQFNLSGEITHIRGKGEEWPDRQEWLKRTVGNDWVYYSTGGYTGVFEAIGEYYLPNFQYPTNALIGGKPFLLDSVKHQLTEWYEQLLSIKQRLNGCSHEVVEFMNKVLVNSPDELSWKAEKLMAVCGGRVSVLPPDSRHVDYQVIPLTVSTGCLYKCRFCKIKSPRPFSEKSKTEIDKQLNEIGWLLGDNLVNYNSVFLGEHDSLGVSPETLHYSVEASFEMFNFSISTVKGANYYLFGSVDSFLAAPRELFAELNRYPASFFINIGLESADQETLDQLGKPIEADQVVQAFHLSQEINDQFMNVEITLNFLMDESLPANHYKTFLKLVRDSVPKKKPKGCVYLSPLRFNNPSRELMYDFNRLKLESRLPTFLYIIQRL